MDTADPSPIDSPCVQICELDADDICLGCGRSLAEIGDWLTASDSEKLEIRARAAARLARHCKTG